METRVLTLKAPNGEELQAPTGVWLLAIYDLMSDADRSMLFERVKKMRDDMMNQNIITPNTMQTQNIIQLHTKKPDEITYDKSGKKHIRMFAEPGEYEAKLIKEATARRKKERLN